MTDITVGFAMCGSFCTFEKALAGMKELVGAGWRVQPIQSRTAAATDTRFGRATDFRRRAEQLTGRPIIDSITAAEPIGPQGLCDLLIVAPCTGNTLAKLAASATDTPVTMAVKSQLRGGRPVLIALSTNDGLAGSLQNLAALAVRRHYFFVPMVQDDPIGKPTSLVADYRLLLPAAKAALAGRQLRPLFLTAED